MTIRAETEPARPSNTGIGKKEKNMLDKGMFFVYSFMSSKIHAVEEDA